MVLAGICVYYRLRCLAQTFLGAGSLKPEPELALMSLTVNMGFFPSALAVSLLLPSDCAASQLVSTWTFRSLASGGPVLYNWEGFGFGFYSFF